MLLGRILLVNWFDSSPIPYTLSSPENPMSEEQVLVIPIETYRRHLNGGFHGFRSCGPTTLKKLVAEALFINREAAEIDPNYKQLIPYVLIMNGAGVFNYLRTPAGEEARLHNKRSVGVGGHINPVDQEVNTQMNLDLVMNAVVRELMEEVRLPGGVTLASKDSEMNLPQFVGLINTTDSEVGAVHLGLTFVMKVASMEGIVPEEEEGMHDAGFHAVGHLSKDKREELEAWSAIAVDAILNHEVTTGANNRQFA